MLYSSLLGKTRRCWGQRRSGNIPMPRGPQHALIWSVDRTCYELVSHGQPVPRFRLGDDEAWLSWLADQTACAFHVHAGHLNLHNEQRTCGTRYWYAYHATQKRTK